jgi:hypothetical protein
MTWDDLKARARSVVPAQELKAKRCWIGVLCHDKAPQDHFEELDFVWMIGHGVSTSFLSRAKFGQLVHVLHLSAAAVPQN